MPTVRKIKFSPSMIADGFTDDGARHERIYSLGVPPMGQE
jgi:hypothetical protein